MPAVSRKIAAGFGWALVSNFVLRLANVGVSILLARMIAPEAFGVFAVALTVWSVLGTLAEMGLGSDVIRSEAPGRMIPTVGTIGLASGLLLAGAMFVGAPAIAASFASPESTDVVRVMSLGMVVIGLTIVPSALLVREYRQRTLMIGNAVGLLLGTAITVVLVNAGHGAMSLAVGQVAGQAVTGIVLYAAVRRVPVFGWNQRIAIESLSFCMPLAAANLVSWLLLSIDNVIVGRELGTKELGFYLIAFNVASWPMSAVGQAIRLVALPALSQVEGRQQRAQAFLRAITVVLPIAVLLGLALATTAGPIIEALYGSRWVPAAAALTGLAVFGALRVLLDLAATFLIACGATRSVLVVQVLWIGAMVPAMIVSVREFGLAGAGWAHIAVAVAVAVPAYLVCLRMVGVDLRALAGVAMRTLPLAVPVALASTLLVGSIGQPWLALLAGAALCAVAYSGPLAPALRRSIRQLRTGFDDEDPMYEGLPGAARSDSPSRGALVS